MLLEEVVILLVLILTKRLRAFTIRLLVYSACGALLRSDSLVVLAHALFRSRSLKSRIAYKSSMFCKEDRREGSQRFLDDSVIDSDSVVSAGMTVRTPMVTHL